MDADRHDDRDRDRHDAIRRILGIGNSATIQIQAGSMAAIFVGAIGALAVVVAVAVVIVVAIWRQADIRDMAQLRARLSTAEAYVSAHERRINEIERDRPADPTETE